MGEEGKGKVSKKMCQDADPEGWANEGSDAGLGWAASLNGARSSCEVKEHLVIVDGGIANLDESEPHGRKKRTEGGTKSRLSQ
jgi:hypothetical protein